ncbi:FAD:protein FMN transferase [Aestuariibacter sp. A3R04]|uniref:FAD:protein FMN transferase n=1 Tax=Aestuariibacter sp. A3R04 TaxID=2841571 RepID=UPI00352E92A9
MVLLLLLVVSGCAREAKQVAHLHGETMGTTYNVKYVVDERGQIDGLQEAIDERLVHINKLMSTYDPTSELSRFNQRRYTTPYTLSDETAKVVKEAIRLGKLSNGVLDVTVGPLVNMWGFGPNKRPEKVPSAEQIADVRKYVGLDKLTLNGNALSKTHPMLYVDLSTIAKGYGVDQVADIMESRGISNYLVEIGGEMRVKGERGNGEAWLIAIEKPVTTERAVQKIVSIGTNAIATSGDYRNYYEVDGKRYSHLIDPRTGQPITHNLVSVTVVHPSSMTADGLATAFNVMGWDEAIALAKQEGLAVFLIKRTEDGFEEYASPHFEDIVSVKD